MLIYNPAMDPYHCAVRLLAISELAEVDLPFETAQILDLIFLFPGILVEATLPKQLLTLRRLAAQRVTPFRQQPRGRAAIDSIQSIQLAAVSTLAVAGLVSQEKLRGGLLAPEKIKIPTELAIAINSFKNQDREFLADVVSSLARLPARGKDGLKHRTGLMEYRYDTV